MRYHLKCETSHQRRSSEIVTARPKILTVYLLLACRYGAAAGRAAVHPYTGGRGNQRGA
jgi:hypothetical protein